MTEILTWIMDSIRAYGAWSVFAGVIIESVIMPIPSPLIIMGAGFILISPELGFLDAFAPILLSIVVPGAIGSTVGAFIGYGLGYFGGKPLIDRWEKFLGFGWSDVEAMETRFNAGRVNASIFCLRALPIFPLSVISVAAGLIRLPVKHFTLWTFYGSIPRCLFLGYLGWGLGETYRGWATGIDKLESVISALLLIAIVGGTFWLRARVRGKILKNK